MRGGVVLDRRYRLGSLIGRGATGSVWEAHDVVLDRTVALKLLHGHLAGDASAVKRFRREADCARMLDHLHVVKVEAFGVCDETAFLVMERLAGDTLAQRLAREGPMSVPRAIQIGAQILDGLEAAHDEKLVHRDLKPGNILLVSDGQGGDLVKICDFGLARLLESPNAAAGAADPSVATLSGFLCGTPRYMSPEQARGERLDHRADLYSVAVVLYELLTARAPFEGASPVAVLSRQLFAPPAPPSAFAPHAAIPPALDRLILRALAKDRRDRPGTAAAFRADLLQIGRDLSAGAATDTVDGPITSGRSETVHLRRGLALGAREIGVALTSLSLLVAAGVLAGTLAAGRDTPAASQRARPIAPAGTPAGPGRPAPAAAPPSPVAAAPTPPRRRGGALQQAETLLAEGHAARACSRGSAAAERAPDRADLQRFLGRCYLRLGDERRSDHHYRRYLELVPDASDAVFVRAMLAD